MTNHPNIFDRALLQKKYARASKKFTQSNFLFSFAHKQMLESLSVVKKEFIAPLQIGTRGEAIYDDKKIDIAENEILPIDQNNYDFIASNLSLHSTNDLPGVMSQIQLALKPDGLFIASLFGGETLFELRNIMQQVEMELYGGISPRVFPFADLPQMGSLMQRANFNLPVIDSEKVTVSYDNIFKLFHDLRNMGETNIIHERRKKFTSRTFFMKVAEEYQKQYAESDGRIIATFEIIFLLGWKPHDSQQKPLRPGTAKNRLADALNTDEGNLPC